jgi:hypothetical protein
LSGVDLRTPHGFAHDDSAKLGRGKRLERTLELAHGRTDGGNDDGFSHAVISDSLDGWICNAIQPEAGIRTSDPAGGAEIADFIVCKDAGADEEADAFGIIE